MKSIVFISNFLNHHQKPIADFLFSKLGTGYHFVSCCPTPDRFLSLGYDNLEDIPYNILAYKNDETMRKVEKLVEDADVVIMGGTRDNNLINIRLKTKKLLLFYSERWLRTKVQRLAVIPRIVSGYGYRMFSRYNRENCYMLCAGAYVPNDCHAYHSFKGKTVKWGYFPPFHERDLSVINHINETIEIIWVARWLPLKHPFLAIKAIEKLHHEGYNVHLTMIGGVDKTEKGSNQIYLSALNYIKDHGLKSIITIAGVLPNAKVQDKMLQSDIFLFTSDRNEGWGAVLNEAMANGCACIASNKIGASPYLISNNENGFIFDNQNLEDLIAKIRFLLANTNKLKDFKLNAYNTIKDVWSPEKAANNLLSFCDSLILGEENPIKNGPCSPTYPYPQK